MLRQDVFHDPSINEIYPGRLLHARALHKKSQLNVDIIGLYQHVHRPNLTPDLNQKYRALQCEVGDRLATLAGSSHDLLLVRNNINQILLDAAVQHFPPRSVPDNRISAQGVFRASAKHTWQLYRVLKAPRITVPHSVFLKWREACAFVKASKLLREQSRQLKRKSLLDKLAEAESAAAKGDQRVLHKIVRSLAPGSCKIISRLRDPQGQLLGKEASLQAMLAYAKDTFCSMPDVDSIMVLQKDWPHTHQEVQAELQKLGAIAPVLNEAFQQHFKEARILLRTNCVDRFQQYEGKRKLACIGALSLSLDLSKAYDLTSRPIVYGTLAEHGVDPDTIQIIQQLHLDAQYVFRAGDSTKGQTTTNGLKQGCCIAPFLWSFYTVALMHALRNKWLQRTLVLFADDHWCHWLIRCRQDWQDAIAQLVVVLETLVSFKMSINYRKTAILVRLEGKQAKAIMYEYTRLKNGVRHLVVTVRGREELIPIKEEHEYLGTKVTYHHRLDRNLSHRMQAGQAKYQAIRKPLNGHHHLSMRHRERLWRACVSTSMFYSLSAVGVTQHGLDKLTKACTRHLRAIQRQPAHLTHTPNTAIWQQAKMDMPGRTLLNALINFRAGLQKKAVMSPDITTQQNILDHLCSLEAQLQHQVQQQEQHDANVSDSDVPQIPRPECDAFFLTENAMRIHCQVSHGILPPRAACEPTKFVPRLHACGGLPRCQLCLRSFYRWQNLKQHIESGACTKLGGESQSKCPDSCRDSQVTDLCLPTASEPTDADHGIKQNVPLVDRQFFRSKQHDWESLLRDSALRVELRSLLEATEVNPEASIFAFCDPSLLAKAKQETKQEVELDPEGSPNLEEANQPPKRPRPAEGNEDTLAAQRVDKVFIVFVRQDYASIIPNLHSISQQFHQKTQDGSGDPQITSPLRIQKMVSTSEGQGKLQAAGWMNDQGEWTFLKFCHNTRKLVQDTSRTCMSHQEIVRQYTFLLENMKGEIVQQFNSTQSLKVLEAQTGPKPQATFILQISLRGERANEMHETMCTLLGSAAWQLVGVSLKRGTLKRSPLAEQLAQLVYGR
ncbi:Pol [Symbiodinium sp. CCMP2592]|nr:Pol [Symbiodinium sp. CCMP2592]